MHHTTAEHTRGNTSVSTNCVIATCAEGLFHSRAGVTGPRAFHQHATYRELRPAKRKQVDAADYDVPAQQCRINALATKELRHYGKMLCLNQRHLSFARRIASEAVSSQSLACASLDTSNY